MTLKIKSLLKTIFISQVIILIQQNKTYFQQSNSVPLSILEAECLRNKPDEFMPISI